MLFNSIEFLLFFSAAFVAYWLIPGSRQRLRVLLLLVASYVFYSWWDWRFLGLIIVSSATDYLVGLGLAATTRESRRRLLLFASLATNLGILFTFKYFDFFIASFAALLTSVGLQPNVHSLNLILPVGISFYTFQTLSYTIDLYRRQIPGCRDPLVFFTFVAFFPQLVAGPIERASKLLPQFEKPHAFDAEGMRKGLEMMLWGLFVKVVIADNLSPTVEQLFASPGEQHALLLWAGAFCFALQIYGDFAGYSLIAIGTARCLGFRLTQNFNHPYFSRSPGEFWHRWHISLSSWFRDYVYIPLGGNRCGPIRQRVNLLATFGLSGLWHGANWTFVVWGLLNGLWVMLLRPVGTPTGLHALAWRLITFAAILVAWVFFRAADLGEALTYLAGMFGNWQVPMASIRIGEPVGYGVLLLLIEWWRRNHHHPLELEGRLRRLRWPVYYLVILLILEKGNFDYVPFIYFQF